ncbi:MAG TPA: hypothetical protein VGH77_26150, partial [Streptosporangiaceae bacterium]
PQTVVYDPHSARLVRAAHLAAEHGDRLASSALLQAALAGLLRAHARAPFLVVIIVAAGTAAALRAAGLG